MAITAYSHSELRALLDDAFGDDASSPPVFEEHKSKGWGVTPESSTIARCMEAGLKESFESQKENID